MDTRHENTARAAIRHASHRLQEAGYHATFPPDIPARVIGELVLAREALTTAQDAVARWIDQEADRAVHMGGLVPDVHPSNRGDQR